MKPSSFKREASEASSNISSTESDANISLMIASTAIDILSITWKSDLADKIKRDFSKQWLCQYYCMDVLNGW